VIYADDMAARPNLCTVFYSSGAAVEDSSLAQDMDACMRYFCACFVLCGYTSTYMIRHKMFEVLKIFSIGIWVVWVTTLCLLVHSFRDLEMLSASIFGVVAIYPGLYNCLQLQDPCRPIQYA
jgi:hypothetical protein